ncbi:MAG: type II secretion system F family protein [Planctomycetota bacterium]|nr:type II secretion system F family protein [Planctomycetota bacterium]
METVTLVIGAWSLVIDPYVGVWSLVIDPCVGAWCLLAAASSFVLPASSFVLGQSSPLQASLPYVASLLIGTGVALAAWWLLSALSTDDLQQGAEWQYDVNRVNQLRRTDSLFRLFQPLIQALARINRNACADSLPTIDREIGAAGLSRFWLPEEYLARCQLIALLCGPLFVWFFSRTAGLAGVFFAAAAVLLLAWYLRVRLTQRARYRIVLIKRRMPFLLDLLTLLMEAGTTFMQALHQAVREFENQPVAVEFGRVLTDMNLGKTRTESFQAMQERLNDDEITSIVGSIIQGEDLGSPLAQTFRTQADVLRIKRTQRAEKVAAEAGVNMLLPAVLVMMATVLIILGPFVVNMLYAGLF